MAPEATSKMSKSQAQNVESEVMSLDASQEAEAEFFKNLMDQHRKRTAERRQQRKHEILVCHRERMGGVKSKMDECIKNHNNRVKGMRHPKIQSLMVLAVTRRELEDKINGSKAELEQALLSVSNALQLAIESE